MHLADHRAFMAIRLITLRVFQSRQGTYLFDQKYVNSATAKEDNFSNIDNQRIQGFGEGVGNVWID
jgi:hypothetical protein